MTFKEKYQQYEERIANLASANKDLIKQVHQLEEMIKLQKESLLKEFEEQRYQDWKSQNGEFLKRFVKEETTNNLMIEKDPYGCGPGYHYYMGKDETSSVGLE